MGCAGAGVGCCFGLCDGREGGQRQQPARGGAAQHARRRVLCTVVALGPLQWVTLCVPPLLSSAVCRAAYSKAAELLQHAPALTWEHASFHCTCRAICRAAYSKVQELRQALDTEWAAFKQANAAYHQQQVRVQ